MCNMVFLNGLVHMGKIKNGDSVIGVIPEGYRPDTDRCVIISATPGSYVNIFVKNNGH